MNEQLRELEEWLRQQRDGCELLKVSLRSDTEEGRKMILSSIAAKHALEAVLAKIAELRSK